MAIGDYILCCKCGCKLLYDGDRSQRDWWADRWGSEPQIECPDCAQPRPEVELTDEEIDQLWCEFPSGEFGFARAVIAAYRAKQGETK
jgi:hypothetical protein